MKDVNHINQTIKLYSDLGWKSLFTRIRFWDAPYITVEKYIPKSGLIVDLGCGEGIFTNFLGLVSKKRKLLGLEVKTRITLADRGLPNVKFKLADITKTKIPRCDAIILFHVLHHLESFEQQKKILKDCIKNLKRKGRLIIVEIDTKPLFKFFITWVTDHFITPWLFEGKFYESRIYFRNSKQWHKLFEELRIFSSEVRCDKHKPFSHTIFICQKR